MTSFILLFPWILVTLIQCTDYSRWMTDNALLLSPKTLGNICLVGTHNSGAYNLSNKIIDVESYGSPATVFYKNLGNIASATGQSFDYFVGLFMAGIRAGSECTTKNVYSQLMDGNRALDLRLSVFENDIYLAHVLQGPSLSDVLLQVWDFLQKTNGEIVFMTLGHPYGFNQTYIDRLALLLHPFIVNGIIITPIEYPGDLLNYTYGQLITNGISRIIIVIDDIINPDVNSFFSTSIYSPPDGGSEKLYGFYTNNHDINAVIKSQTAIYIHAREISAPSAIYMTLTPTYNDMVSIIISKIVADLHPLTKSIVLSFFRTMLLSENMGNLNLTCKSLHDIYIQQDMIAKRASIVTNIQPIPSSSIHASIFLLYTDFYENNKDIIDLAIFYSTA